MRVVSLSALSLCLALGLAACEPPKPCTDCPRVRGMYHVVMPPSPPSKSSCGRLAFGGLEVPEMEIAQGVDGAESRLIFMLFGQGTLMQSMDVRFEAFDFPLGRSGSNAQARMYGHFEGEEGAWVFEGHLTATIRDSSDPDDGCTINSPVTATQIF